MGPRAAGNPAVRQRKSTSADEIERVLQQQGLGPAAKLYREKHSTTQEAAMRAMQKLKERLERPLPPEPNEWVADAQADAQALAINVFGPVVPMLLGSEHGLHRIYAEAEAFEVKVRFSPGIAAELEQGEALDVALPAKEIRRAWPTRKGQEFGLLRDRRTETEHRLSGTFNLAPVLAAYIRHIVFGSAVFGAAEGSWS